MVSSLSRACSDQADSSGGMDISLGGQDAATNALSPILHKGRKPPGRACFPGRLAPNRDREIGGGRATRQPGQVRKEAALTRSGSGRSSVSYLFFPAKGARCCDRLRPLPQSQLREIIHC